MSQKQLNKGKKVPIIRQRLERQTDKSPFLDFVVPRKKINPVSKTQLQLFKMSTAVGAEIVKCGCITHGCQHQTPISELSLFLTHGEQPDVVRSVLSSVMSTNANMARYLPYGSDVSGT